MARVVVRVDPDVKARKPAMAGKWQAVRDLYADASGSRSWFVELLFVLLIGLVGLVGYLVGG